MSGMRIGWLVAACVACNPDTGATTGIGTETLAECAQNDVVIACGTGETAFVALTDGATMQMVHGPQGGWHLNTSVQAQYSEQDVALLPTITVDSLGDLKISSTTPPGDFVALAYDAATCQGTYFGQQARLEPSVIDADPQQAQAAICTLAGEAMHLRMDLTNLTDGRTASCEVDVIVELDPADVEICADL